MYFLASKKKIEFLKPAESHKEKEENVPAIKLMIRDRNDKDKENFSKLVAVLKASISGKAVGVFSKDGFPGEFCKTWKEIFKENSFETADISSSIAYIMAPKEDSELVTIKKSSMVSADVFGKYLKEHIMEVIDAEKVSFFINGVDRSRIACL